MRVELTEEQYRLVLKLLNKEADRLEKLKGTYKTPESIERRKSEEAAVWDLRFTMWECKKITF